MKNKVIFILKILLVTFIAFWIVIVVIDYFNARGGKDAKFCIKSQVKIYSYDEESNRFSAELMSKKEFEQLDNQDDISYTYECIGVGYKFYRYHRLYENPEQGRDFSAVEFGPFFIKERQSA